MHVHVVDDYAEVVGRRAVRARDDQVIELRVLKRHRPVHQVLHHHRAIQGIAKTYYRIDSLAERAAIAADAGVARLLLARDLLLAQRIQFLLRAVTVIGAAGLQHAPDDFAVTIETLRLIVRTLVRVEPEPGHALENHPHRLRGGALAVRVLDTQNEPAARAPRVQPAEQRRARAANVQQPGGAGRKARDDRHGGPADPSANVRGAHVTKGRSDPPRPLCPRGSRGRRPRFAFALGPP